MTRNNYYIKKMWNSSSEIVKRKKYSITKKVNNNFIITYCLSTIYLSHNERNIISDISIHNDTNRKFWR